MSFKANENNQCEDFEPDWDSQRNQATAAFIGCVMNAMDHAEKQDRIRCNEASAAASIFLCAAMRAQVEIMRREPDQKAFGKCP